jgi:hypothetical protein
MIAWIRADLEQMDMHNVVFVLQVGFVVGIALFLKVCG